MSDQDGGEELGEMPPARYQSPGSEDVAAPGPPYQSPAPGQGTDNASYRPRRRIVAGAELLTYRGRRPDGDPQTGLTAMPAETFAQRMYARGWRELTVTRAGAELASIRRDSEGRRVVCVAATRTKSARIRTRAPEPDTLPLELGEAV